MSSAPPSCTTLYWSEQSLEEQSRYISTLIKQLTSKHTQSTAPPSLQQLTPLLSTVHGQPGLLHVAVDGLYQRLAVQHSNVRILALHCIDALIDRSHTVRQHIFSGPLLNQLFELTLGVSSNHPSRMVELPPPLQSRTELRTLAQQYIVRWQQQYGRQHKLLDVGCQFLRTTIKVPLPTVQQDGAGAGASTQHTQAILRARYERCVEELDAVCSEVDSVMREMNGALEMLVPELVPDSVENDYKHQVTADVDASALESTSLPDRSYDDELIDEQLYEQYMQQSEQAEPLAQDGDAGVLAASSSAGWQPYSIEIDVNQSDPAADAEHTELLHNILRTSCKHIQTRFLPILNEYVDTLIRVVLSDPAQHSVQQQLLHRVSQQRAAVLQAIAQCVTIGLVSSHNMDNATDRLQQFAQHALTPHTTAQPSARMSQQQYAHQKAQHRSESKRQRAAAAPSGVTSSKRNKVHQPKPTSKLQRLRKQFR